MPNVYCDAEDCSSNEANICTAISISINEDCKCEDFENREEEDEN